MSVIIGIDPHKLLHAACAIDERETELARLEVRTNSRQVADLLAWATPFECRSWAIESAGGLGYLLAQQLVARGEHVVDVPATLSSRVRLLGSGKSTKNDANDARAVAVAALRAPQLAAVQRRGSRHDPAAARQEPARHQPGEELCVLPSACAGRRVGAGRDPQGNRCQAGRTDPRWDRADVGDATPAARSRLRVAVGDRDARRPREAEQAADDRRGTRVSNDAHRCVRDRPDPGRDDHRLHRRHHIGSRRQGTTPPTTGPPRSSSHHRAARCIGCRVEGTGR